ncbi:MAG: heme-binding protein [Planctomycetota bacterium]|nr:heme-binding protein [Planctomycetota bacterium]
MSTVTNVLNIITACLIGIGGLNWGLMGLFSFSPVDKTFDDLSVLSRIMMGGTDTAYRSADLVQQVCQELTAEPPDSDAAVILAAALTDAGAAPADRQSALLETGIEQAAKARRFKPTLEAPLPEGWPAPSLPGLIRLKTYPPMRAAWTEQGDGRNGQFMTLFRHIKDRQIPMTAPVVMAYPPAEAAPPRDALGEPVAMAFLYRQTTQDTAGPFGAVRVTDDPPLQVVSAARKGMYSSSNFQASVAQLRAWLQAHPEWQAAGPPRVLAYNSPFMPFWMKYAEVQIPVRATAKELPAARTTSRR